jgi:hypothetical protein
MSRDKTLLSWTQEAPTKPGRYWHCRDGSDGCSVVRVEETANGKLVYLIEGVTVALSNLAGGWWQRLLAPELPSPQNKEGL